MDSEIRAHRMSDLNEGYKRSRTWTAKVDELAKIRDRQETDGVFYLTTGFEGDLYAYDATDGTRLWEMYREDGVYHVLFADGQVYYAFDHAGVGQLSIEPQDESDDTDRDPDDSGTTTEPGTRTDTATGTTPSDTVDGPGFTLQVALVALVTVALLAVRRARER